MTNISFYNDYATVCGLTKDEIESCLGEELHELANKKGWNMDDTLSRLKDMYDGYHLFKLKALCNTTKKGAPKLNVMSLGAPFLFCHTKFSLCLIVL